MKKTLALTLCAALILAPIERARAHAVAAICLIGGFALAAGVVIFTIKSCKPKYYCVKDEDGNRFASSATKKERLANDWRVVSGPYSSAEEAHRYCPPVTATNTASLGPVMAEASEPFEDEIALPEIPIKIWKSTDAKIWSHVDTILDDPFSFSWDDTNAVSQQAFYKVSY